jgi:hypothetical protein
MNPLITFFLSVGGMFAAVLTMLETGRRLGTRYKSPGGEKNGSTAAVEGAVFALMGLLIAFTFSGAASRFDERRRMIVQEANAIGTAYLRIDLLPADMQAPLRAKFREYLDARLAFYGQINEAAGKAEFDRAVALQSDIWKAATAGAARIPSPAITSLVISSVNDMFDITVVRAAARQLHPPTIIYIMLGVLVLFCSLLAGYDMSSGGRRKPLHMIGFATVLTLSVYVILDLEYPRAGLIRVDKADQLLVDVRQSMR